jgi:hypothetical protein
MVALAKGWSSLQQQIDDDSSSESKPPPVAQPQMRRPRASPPRSRPATTPMTRTATSYQRPDLRTTPPSVGSPPRGTWRVDAQQIRRFRGQLRDPSQSTPPPIAHPPVQEVEAAVPLPPPQMESTEAMAATKQTTVNAPSPSKVSRAAQWIEALRDRQNLRNIIIAAEIIGPPKAL